VPGFNVSVLSHIWPETLYHCVLVWPSTALGKLCRVPFKESTLKCRNLSLDFFLGIRLPPQIHIAILKVIIYVF